jgi:glycosyltransferase involved in cell wall biosynthesis
MNAHAKTYSIALVVPAFTLGGGVPAMALFLHRVMCESGRYTPHIVSLSMSSRDRYSLRLLSPPSWLTGVQIVPDTWNGLSFHHAGAILTELEFQRYQPRPALTSLLNTYDLVQIVAGTPPWGLVARDVQCPICLYVATTTQNERVSVLTRSTGWRRYWSRLMTHVNVGIERAALASMSYVVAESVYTHRVLKHLVPQSRLELGVPGIDTALFSSPTYQPDSYMLAVGRFSDPRKNVRLLFTAYHQVCQHVPDLPQLVLVGDPPLPQDQEYAQSLGIANRIDCRGPLVAHSPELAAAYRGASLFVLSSDEEGLGIVILEAMASGLPVVSTRCGGPETAVIEGETGYLTPVDDAPAMADAMRRLLTDPALRQQMGQRGRQIAEERFSIAAAGKVFLDRYDTLLGQEP